jgi:O-antigen/teichoic acid export membrane protein
MRAGTTSKRLIMRLMGYRAKLRICLLLILDQGTYSLSNFSLFVLAAHMLSPRDFGLLSACVTVGLIALGCARAIGGEALAIRWGGAAPEEFVRAARGAVTASLGVASIITALAAIFLALIWQAPGIAAAILPAIPSAILQDSLRYVLLADGRPRTVVYSDMLMLVLQLGAFAILVFSGLAKSPEAILLAWCTAALISALAAMAITRAFFSLSDLRRWLSAVLDLAPKLMLDFAIHSGAGQISLLAVSAFLGVVEFGYLRLAYLALGPLNILILSMVATGLPLAARTGRQSAERLRHLTAALSWLAGGSALLWTGALLVIPSDQITRVLGPQWVHARGLIPAIGLAYVATGLSSGPVLRLRASSAMSRLVRTRLAAALPTILLPVLAAIPFGLLGAAWGYGLAASLGAGQWLRASIALTRATRSDAESLVPRSIAIAQRRTDYVEEHTGDHSSWSRI